MNIEILFNDRPVLINNKWKTRHTFGASDVFSLETAIFIFKKEVFMRPFRFQIKDPSRRL
ncbi:MAG: hypothetical protein ABI045_03535 [Flavobacteriales bacterium]